MIIFSNLNLIEFVPSLNKTVLTVSDYYTQKFVCPPLMRHPNTEITYINKLQYFWVNARFTCAIKHWTYPPPNRCLIALKETHNGRASYFRQGAWHHRSLASHFPTCYYYCVKTVSLFLTDLLLRYWISIKSLAGDVDVYDLVALVNRQRINLLLPLGRYFWSNNSGCFFMLFSVKPCSLYESVR